MNSDPREGDEPADNDDKDPADEEDIEDEEPDDDEENEAEEQENHVQTPIPHSLLGSLQNLQETVNSINSFKLDQIISPGLLRMLRGQITPDLRQILVQPVIDPEIIRQLQQPVIDPAVLRAIQQPMIDPDILRGLAQPAIDPELIESLQVLNSSAPLEIYRIAAALEQLDQEDVEEGGESIEEELEDELKEPEPPQPGGFLSTFLNISAVVLLQQPDQYPEESIQALYTLVESADVQSKKDALKSFVQSAGGSAAQGVMFAFIIAFNWSWGMHFAGELDVDDEEEDEDKEDDGDEE